MYDPQLYDAPNSFSFPVSFGFEQDESASPSSPYVPDSREDNDRGLSLGDRGPMLGIQGRVVYNVRFDQRDDEHRAPGGPYSNVASLTTPGPDYDFNDGTELYSIHRRPFPHCQPGTCEELINTIESGSDSAVPDPTPASIASIRWITGPPGSGKSALAQTIAERGCAAAFFFSRSLNRTDPSRLWVNIAMQLAKKLGLSPLPRPGPTPSIFDFKHYFESYLGLYADRLKDFIIIDGLDECDDKWQSEVIMCIWDSVRRHAGYRWMIFSRPESHLRQAFEKAESEGVCWIKEIRVDSPEMKRDVKEYLEKEFRKIGEAYITDVDKRKKWPGQAVMDKMINVVAGLFIYAVTIVKFVADHQAKDPIARLQTVIDTIDGVPASPHMPNPMSTIDTLYRGLIKRTPRAVLPLTLKMLGMLIVCPPLPLFHFACLLEIDLRAIHDALLSLHSVVAVPSGSKSFQAPLHYFHASFPDFLVNPSRAKDFTQSPIFYRTLLAESCFRVLSDDITPNISKKTRTQGPAADPPLCITLDIVEFASIHLWQICTQITSPDLNFAQHTVGSFQFSRLRIICETLPVVTFVRFLTWLHNSTQSIPKLAGLVRTKPLSERDEHLIKACEDVSKPLDLENESAETKEDNYARHALIGFGSETVIVLAVSESVMVYSIEDIGNI